MHPEIKKFWECKGYTIFYYLTNDKEWVASTADYQKGERIARSIIAPEGRVIYYYWDNRLHSEKRMLKMIRMKAFL